MKRKYHADESEAEALYQHVEYFHSKMYKKFGYQQAVWRKFIYCGLIEYFRGVSRIRRRSPSPISIDFPVVDKDTVKLNMNEEMLSWLSGILNSDEDAMTVIGYLREGLSFDELEFLEHKIKYTSRSIHKQVANRLRRLIKLKKAGIAITRDVKLPEEYEDADVLAPAELQTEPQDSGLETVGKAA